MKKLFLIIIILFCSIYIGAETNVSLSSGTVQTQTLNGQLRQKDENNLGVQVKVSTNSVNVSSNTKEVTTAQVNKSTDTVKVSTNTVNNNTTNSTNTVNISTNTQNIDITMPLKYKELKSDKNIEVSSMTVIPDENDLGTYYSSGAIVEKPQKDSNYDLNLPTTTALGIAGEQVLDKLKLNKSTDTVLQKEIMKSTSTIEKKLDDKNTDKGSTVKQSLPKKLLSKLPFDSDLILSGRKLIGINYSGKMYDNEESGKRTNSSDFSMEQELQMKIKGTVGDRLELNVDFDDTQDDKKDIYILYKGKGNEFVREAAFGDINVELPSTEFSGYSKELFGAKVDTQYKGLKTKAFFSKTKGYSESKQFKGSSKTEKKTIADTAYIKYKYYSIIKDSSSSKAIINGTAKVYLDKIKKTVTDYIVISTSTDLYYMKESPQKTKYNGNFIKLVAGTDYIIDYTTGILSFKSTLSSEYVVAIDYQYEDGSWLSDTTNGNPQIIKDTNNTDALSTEVHTFYSLGNYQITKYNGRDNFILEVRDLNNTVPQKIDNSGGYPSTKPVPKFPNIDGYEANIIVDYENGVFNLQPVTGKPLHDSLYTSNTHKYNFVTEYQYKVKIFNLRTDIVPMSEKVVANGKTLKINEDYMIDYDVGILTILKDEYINDDTVIDVSYDYSPLGGSAAGSTLVGVRSQYDFTNNISLGGSFIYEFTAEDNKLPDIYSTPSSTLVGEFDAKVNNIKITDSLTVSANAEYAMSQYIQNTAGKAIIESMESSKQDDSFSLIDDNWFYSSVVMYKNDGSYTHEKYDVNAITWKNYDIEKKEIDKNLELISGEKQQVMDINYNFLNCHYASIGQIISLAGYDFSKKLYLEIWIKANFAQVDVRLDLASSINEDSDNNNKLDTEDVNGDGIISPWEDIGRDFKNYT